MILGIIEANVYLLSTFSMVMMVGGALIMLGKSTKCFWWGAGIFALGAFAGFVALGTDMIVW